MGSSPRSPVEVNPELLRRLDEAWEPARSSGALGSAPLEALRLHASGYILNEWHKSSAGQFVDCGAGVGVLGVLLALELPGSHWRLVDAKRRRCEMAQRAVAAAELTERTVVEHARVEDVARSEFRGTFDGVVARSFGPAPELAECALPLLKVGGTLVVSVSTSTMQQWRRMPLVERTGCDLTEKWSTAYGHFLSVKRIGPMPPDLPRRQASRRRAPLGDPHVPRETSDT